MTMTDGNHNNMDLPTGKTCGDCINCRLCCSVYGHTITDTYCDWSQSRFVDKSTTPVREKM